MSLADKLKVGAVLTVGALVIGSPLYLSHTDRDTYTVRITDKQVKRSGDSDKYLVFGKDSNGTSYEFQNTDSPIELKWDSSSLQGELEIGKTYNIQTYGWRIPILSKYENIVGVQEVSPVTTSTHSIQTQSTK